MRTGHGPLGGDHEPDESARCCCSPCRWCWPPRRAAAATTTSAEPTTTTAAPRHRPSPRRRRRRRRRTATTEARRRRRPSRPASAATATSSRPSSRSSPRARSATPRSASPTAPGSAAASSSARRPGRHQQPRRRRRGDARGVRRRRARRELQRHDPRRVRVQRPGAHRHQRPRRRCRTSSGSTATSTAGLDVYAAGYPLGDPEFTLTRGIVAKAEAGGDLTGTSSIDHTVEHDATIQPGNSGGPLVDADGKVVAVNYAGGAQATTTAQFYGIASDLAQPVVEQLQHGNFESLGINGWAVVRRRRSASPASGSPASRPARRPPRPSSCPATS